MTTTEPLLINCGSHGKRVSAVVCCHMLKADLPPVGFVENSDDPNDLQAWCNACEAKFQAAGEMTEAFRKFNGMTLVCVTCYAEKKLVHMTQPSGGSYAV